MEPIGSNVGAGEIYPSATVAIVMCVAFVLAYLAIPSSQTRAVLHLPRPPGYVPILGNTLLIARVQLSGRFHDWALDNCRKWKGKPWCMYVLGKAPTVFVSTPEAFEDVQRTQYEAFGKNPLFVEAATDVLGQGVFAISGPLWHHQRKTASLLFSTQMIQHNMDVVVPDKCKELMKRLDAAACQESPVDRVVSFKWMLDLFTMDVFCKVGFGIEMYAMDTQKIVAMLEALQRSSARIVGRILEPSWCWKVRRFLSIGAESQFSTDMKRVNDMLYGFIARSIEEKATQDLMGTDGTIPQMDLISLYLEQEVADNGNGAPFNPRKLRDFLVSFLAAGQDTTATAMSWIVVMINRYPHVLERVRHEIREKLPDLASDKQRVPTLGDTQHLVYLEAVIRETLRLYPVAPISGRTATRDVTMENGVFLAKGTSVHMPHYAMGRMETVWGPNAEEFKPERWIDCTGRVSAVSPFKFSAFYGGPHACLGMKFAMSEMKITLASLLSRFNLKTTRDPFQYTYRMALSLRIDGGLDVVVSQLD